MKSQDTTKKPYTIKHYEAAGAIADLVIPEGFTEIGILTFCKARQKIKSVVFPSTMTTLPEKLFRDCEHLQSVDLGKCYVTVIPKSFFEGCKQLNKVTLPSCLSEIGEEAFHCCRSLKNISIPNTVIKLGDRSFYGCDFQSIKIPDSVKEIGDSAFKYCDSLQDILIPDSVTKIGNEAFYNCSDLQNITLPNGLKTISRYLFSRCYKLQSIIIPDSVTTIEEGAFNCCTSIQNITIPDGVSKIGEAVFYCCDSLQNISLPEGVIEIGESAFNGCYSLKSISIPEGVKEIGRRTFGECKSLKSINLPESIIKIDEDAFNECYSIKSLIIPSKITTIGKRAFARCESLQSINLPDSVTEIGPGAFFDCNLDNLEAESANFKLTGGILIDKINAKIRSSAFVYLTDVVIPDGINIIGRESFQGCESLQSVVIPESIRLIGDHAFKKCSSLKSVIIPGGVTDVGRSAFYDCESLECVTIMSPNTKLHGYSFSECDSLKIVNLPKGLSWTKIKDSFSGSPWGAMSPKAALAAQKAAEEEAARKALQVKQQKVREMSSMAASFVIKQAFEVAFKSETTVTADQGNQWFDINLELIQGMMLKIRMPVVIKMDKVQDYASKLAEKISQLKSIFDGVFAGQNQEANLISISIPSFGEGGGISAKVRMDLNQICTKAGNQICFKSEKEDLNLLLSVGSDLAETFKKLDDFTDIRGEYEFILKNKTYGVGVCLNKALQIAPTVSIPQFVTEVSADSFKGCDNLVEISIPRSTEMSGWPFGECHNLKNINLY